MTDLLASSEETASRPRQGFLRFLLLIAGALLGAPAASPAQEDPAAGIVDDPSDDTAIAPGFDLDDIPDFFDADPIAEEPRLTIHGSIDLTALSPDRYA